MDELHVVPQTPPSATLGLPLIQGFELLFNGLFEGVETNQVNFV